MSRQAVTVKKMEVTRAVVITAAMYVEHNKEKVDLVVKVNFIKLAVKLRRRSEDMRRKFMDKIKH